MSPAEELLLVDHDRMFSVSREREGAGRYFLDVLCGGVGLFERRLVLNSEEIGWLHEQRSLLHTLAAQVRKWPERFEGRISST
jgi:hypothetical protein